MLAVAADKPSSNSATSINGHCTRISPTINTAAGAIHTSTTITMMPGSHVIQLHSIDTPVTTVSNSRNSTAAFAPQSRRRLVLEIGRSVHADIVIRRHAVVQNSAVKAGLSVVEFLLRRPQAGGGRGDEEKRSPSAVSFQPSEQPSGW